MCLWFTEEADTILSTVGRQYKKDGSRDGCVGTTGRHTDTRMVSWNGRVKSLDGMDRLTDG